jgi:hypothetical protein
MANKLKMDSGDSPNVAEALKELDGAAGGGSDPGEDMGSREVEIGAPEKPEADGDDAPEIGDARPSRRERRANRFAEAEEARIRAEERAKVLEQELERRNQQPVPVYQPPPQNQPDPLELATKRLQQEHEDLVATYNARFQATSGQLPPDEQAQFRERGWALKNKSEELAALRMMQKMGKLGPQQNQGMTEQQFVQMQLQSEFPEVYADPRLIQRAGLKFDELVLDGEPATIATSRKAMAEIQARFAPGRRPEPDQKLRQKLTGISAGPGSGPGGRGGRQTIEMTPDYIKMAVRTFRHLPRNQAIQKWANEVGPGLLEDLRREGR